MRNLIESLRKIAHQATAGAGTLDENGTAVGADDFDYIKQTAKGAIADHQKQEKSYTIAYGNPVDGIRLYGLFDSFDEALEVAEADNLDDSWWVMEIEHQKEEN